MHINLRPPKFGITCGTSSIRDRDSADSTIGHSVSEGQKWRDTQRDYFNLFSASLLHVRPQGYQYQKHFISL